MSKTPTEPGSTSFHHDLATLWNAISTSSLDGFWINALDGEILHVNEAYCRMSGYSQDELLQMSIADLEAIETAEEVHAHNRKIREQGHDRFETRHRTKDGRLIDLEISLRLVPEHKVIIAFLRNITEAKARQEQLEKAEAYNRDLLNTGNVLIVKLNNAGEAEFVNTFTTQLTGYSREELLGNNWFDILVPRARFPNVYEEFERLLEGGLPEVFENPILTKNGQEKIISWSNRETRDGDGITGVLSFGIDITEKNRALDDLLKTQQHFADIVETAQDLIWACDPEGRLTYLNPAVKDVLGFEPDELIGRYFKEITPKDRIEPDLKVFEKSLSEKTELLNHESARLAKDGARVDLLINARAMYDTTGELIGMQGTAKDITATKRYLEQLRDSESYLRQIITNAPFGALFYRLEKDRELIFEGGNPSADKILEMDLARFIGKQLEEVFPGLSDSDIPDIYRNLALKGGRYHQDQIVYDTGHIKGAYQFDAFQTVPDKIAVFFSDITERKQNEQALIQAREEALQASLAKDNFLGVMSHELRTPLTPILGFTEMLALRIHDPELTGYLEHITEAGHRMLRLIEDILNYSRISAKPPTLELKPFSIEDHLLRELQRFVTITTDNRIEFEEPDGTRFKPLPEGMAVISEPEILAQIVNNLLGNACKFTHQGTITLRYGFLPDTRRHGTLLVEVEDTGVGISEEKLVCIWEPFTQADSSSSRYYQGVGLGLAICRRLVELLDGEIQVESTPGTGSRFLVRLPVELTPISEQPEADASKEQSFLLPEKTRILVVEDNDMNRLTLQSQIEAMQGETVLAHDSVQALAAIEEHGLASFNLILLDLHLPGMSGLEFYQKLCHDFTAENIPPVIAISADASETNINTCKELGIQDFLAKPVSMTSLHALLDK